MEQETIILSEVTQDPARQTACFLSFVGISFESSDVYASSGIPMEGTKFIKSAVERDSQRIQWCKEPQRAEGSNGMEKG